MDVGVKVLYKDNIYIIAHDYNNGQVEIKKENEDYKYVVANKSELKRLDDA
ncbi:hypothetical protein [Anaerobacillus arseniciselenatis]|uniref:hypothetical protein n=1 Tax=Anaerobacillus arseniciselenatis TaxID=85682 RepID=UPI0014710155|nr:hypothetical protein [Anaerobacillus arseniciselenatis]